MPAEFAKPDSDPKEYPNDPPTPDQPLDSAAPVAETKRIVTLDVIRGLALLGILTMNIPFFAFTSAIWMSPPIDGGFDGLDYATWLGGHFLFEMKMMAIFSTLFGVGVLLFASKARERTGKSAGLHYRRMGWLLVIGLIHAYVIWEGDILVPYAICGMIAYPLHRMKAKWLALIGVLALGVAPLFSFSQSHLFEMMRDAADEQARLVEAGEAVPVATAEMAKAWRGEYDEETGEKIEEGMVEGFYPEDKHLAEEEEAVLGSYYDRMAFRAPDVLFFQTYVFLTWGLWRVVGLMLLGMALYKWGVFTLERSTGFYSLMCVGGFAVGWGIVSMGVMTLHRIEFDTILSFRYGWTYNYVGSLFVAVGWMGLFLLISKLDVLKILRASLANVGRMAFTNYLMQSLICGTIFFGWGLGRFGSLSRSDLVPVVLGIWAFQIIFSALWLKRFRFGPMEWAWRSLTYWRRQPMRG